MNQTTALKGAIAELEQIQLALAAVTNRQGDQWKNELIDLRRKLQIQIARVSEVADQHERLQRSEKNGREFWDRLSRMRSTVALHQANWPAVSIDRNNPEYQRSINAVRSTNRAFIEHAYATITGPRSPASDMNEQ